MPDLLFHPTAHSAIQEAKWSLALLRQMDWKRMQELVAHLLHRAGFMAEIGWIRPDGGVVMTVMNPRKGGAVDALVQCPPWAAMNVNSSTLKELFNAVLQEGASRGIFITAGEFSQEARNFAKMRPLELIDGHGMLRTLLKMPPQEQSYHLRTTTMGPYTVPTCPSCGEKLELRDDTAYDSCAQVKDVVFRDRQIIGEEVSCRTLTIKPGAQVQFMRSVWAQELIVQGRASGNITVQGKLTIGRAGVLSGLVAARTIAIEDGGVIEAETRVLNSQEIQPVRQMPVQQLWRCPGWPRCRGQLPLR